MTRLIIGIDPGQTGALAALVEGHVVWVRDMPVMARRAGGQQVDGNALAAGLRELLAESSHLARLAVLERVGSMPGQGVASAFRFGQSDGVVRGVLGALGIPFEEVSPAAWKHALHLTGAAKDAARTMAIQRFPEVAELLRRKRDVGRADALLIAAWAEQRGHHAHQ